MRRRRKGNAVTLCSSGGASGTSTRARAIEACLKIADCLAPGNDEAVGGNVRGTRIRGRRGQRVISSSVVGLGPTGTIRVRGNDGGGRGGGGGGNFGASRTVRGPVPGEVPRAADGSEWALGTRERGSMSSETSGAGANASRDPASEVKKPIRARTDNSAASSGHD